MAYFRRWEENIWKVIIFSMVMIIAAGLVWLISYFYKDTVKTKAYVSVLWSKYISIWDLHDLWLCKTSSYAKIDYNPLKDTYTLICEKEIWLDISKIPKIITLTDCDSSSKVCKYRFRK